MTIKLYNTKSRAKETLAPIDPMNVRMYVCGPTVYNYAHIGNARPVVIFDVLFRLLRRVYGPKHVIYARNITDIDDKIIDESLASGQPIATITTKYADIYNKDMAALNALSPTIEPRATDHIGPMIEMIEGLIAKGNAYAADGHVLFNVPSMKNYGLLAGRNRDEMIAGARVEVASYKKDPADFVLWKPSTPEQPGWDSPWGRGRPGWHLECSSMIEKNLGETIDIHGGGLDLIFPHHENEIAQSECAHAGAPLANIWVHNGYLTVNGDKMSKSSGNFHTVHDLLDEFGVKGGEAIRLALLSAHYRAPLDFSKEAIREKMKELDGWYRLAEQVEETSHIIPHNILEALSDDLNTPLAISGLNDLRREANTLKEKADPKFAATVAQFKAAANLLGFLDQPAELWFGRAKQGREDATQIDDLIAARNAARKNKDFAESDRIRDALAAKGIILKDRPDGTTEWERQ
jgi:cysteinyl-tRNA synthetase